MANASQMSAASASISSFFLAMTVTSLANAPLVFISLALARDIECQSNARHILEVRVLGFRESPHGNLGSEIIARQANTVRDRKKVMAQLQAHEPNDFLRLFNTTIAKCLTTSSKK
jgi:hypothetical protein